MFDSLNLAFRLWNLGFTPKALGGINMAHREIFWNIPYGVIIYLLVLIPFAILGWGLYKMFLLWRIGKKENRINNIPSRVWSVITFGIFQTRVIKDIYAGVMHLLIFWGFVILTMGAIIDAVESNIAHHLLHTSFLKGTPYLYFSLTLDTFGFFAIVGILMALYRRYVIRPDKLDNKPENAILLIWILVMLITGFLVEGSRMAATEVRQHPDWAIFSPVGLFCAQGFLLTGLTTSGIRLTHQIIWWLHVAIGFGLFAYLPFSMLSHVFLSPLNQFFRSFEAKGALTSIPNLEEAETFGVAKAEEFTWKQLFDLDACLRCGRCQDFCPVYLSEKPFSPKEITQDIKGHWLVVGKKILEGKEKDTTSANLLGDVVKEEALWFCTTCGSCEEQCPIFVEHVQRIVDLRRNLVLMESKFPQEVTPVFKGMETQGNPWGIGAHTRADWAKELGVKKISEALDTEYLYFVGCAGSFDDRGKKVSTAFVKILKQAGVSFAILGEEETCCGDSARRIGNEYLFQMLVEANIGKFKNYKVKKIITCCPHCYNALKNEYPQFGAEFEVYHHTEFINSLINKGKVKISKDLAKTITYHDSCYLGRYNGIYNQPREILKSIPKVRLQEMERRREKSFCCGAGGGRMWMEETVGKRINTQRCEQALKVNPDIISTACPFCLTMLDDAVKEKNLEEKVKVQDIAQLVAEAI